MLGKKSLKTLAHLKITNHTSVVALILLEFAPWKVERWERIMLAVRDWIPQLSGHETFRLQPLGGSAPPERMTENLIVNGLTC